jgi:hypothetical protein
MKPQILLTGNKIVVKTNRAEPTAKAIRKLEKQAGCTLNYCAFRNGGLILWNGPSNVRVAGWAKAPKRLRSETGFNWVDRAGHGRMPEIAKRLQSAYSKVRYSKKWSQRIYESVIRPRANGQTVAGFTAHQLP